MSKIKFIYFDAANTLIHKPDLWLKFDEVLKKYNYEIDPQTLRRNHKLTSERIKFPDNTSKEFYSLFNKEVLISLGISPTEEIINDIFNNCTYLAWKKFDDVDFLKEIKIPLGIISNFNISLKEKITKIIDIPFAEFIVSEEQTFSKPDKRLYEYAIQKINIPPQEILYIGDSIKLDIEPANSLGMQTLLIDRDLIYPDFKKRIASFNELKYLI
jgi:putative hydrolase of the HAD superfamily